MMQVVNSFNPDDLADLVAEILAHAVEVRQRHRLNLGYRSRDAVLNRVGGRNDVLNTERHRSLDRGLVACQAQAGAVCQHPAQAHGAVRQRQSGDPARSLADGVRQVADKAGGQAADHQGKRSAAAEASRGTRPAWHLRPSPARRLRLPPLSAVQFRRARQVAPFADIGFDLRSKFLRRSAGRFTADGQEPPTHRLLA